MAWTTGRAADCNPAIVARTTVPYPASAPAPSSGAAPIRRHACASAAEAADPLERNLPVLYTAGMLAGLSETIFVHPMDTLKVRMQTLRHAGQPTTAVYSDLALLSRGSIRGLMDGIAPAAFRGFIGGAIFLGTNESLKLVLGAKDDYPFSLPFLASAAGTGVLETVIYCPFEMFKTQRQVANHDSALGCAKYFYRNHGVAGMYMGFHSLLWGHIVGNVSFFTVYSLIQHSIKPGAMLASLINTAEDSPGSGGGSCNEESIAENVVTTSIAGGVAGMSYYLLSHPLDTCQACFMSQRYPGELYTGLWDCGRSIVRQSGWSGLMRGVVPNVLQAIPGGAISMLTFETVVYMLDGRGSGTRFELW